MLRMQAASRRPAHLQAVPDFDEGGGEVAHYLCGVGGTRGEAQPLDRFRKDALPVQRFTSPHKVVVSPGNAGLQPHQGNVRSASRQRLSLVAAPAEPIDSPGIVGKGDQSGQFAEIGCGAAPIAARPLISLVTPTGIEPVFQP